MMTATAGKAFLGEGWAFPVEFDSEGGAAMAAYEEEMNKTPEGKKMLKEDQKMAEKVMKEGK